MESFLRWGLLFIAAFVVVLIFYDVWFRRGNRSEDKEEPFITSNQTHHPLESHDSFEESELKIQDDFSPPADNDIIILSVFAKSTAHFASYDLLQAISATGMQYGAMDIFHYYQPTETDPIRLFSLASATKPGKFDLDQMGDFSCIGLSLFMDKRTVPNPKKAFLLMLEKAEQLADDLDGELRIGSLREPCDEHRLQQYLSTM